MNFAKPRINLGATFIFVLLGCKNIPEGMPEVVITYPYDGAYVKDTVIIIAEAIDNVEINKVEFYIDGKLESEDTQAPYNYSWIAGELTGTHTILAKAWDNDDNCGFSNLINVSIIDTTDTEPPQVAIVSPADWSVVSDSVEILTEVSDNIGVAKVSFFIDGNTAFTDSTSPFTFIWDTHTSGNGNHTILAKAFDFSDNWANYMITVNVLNP